jgi:hypothetical protein
MLTVSEPGTGVGNGPPRVCVGGARFGNLDFCLFRKIMDTRFGAHFSGTEAARHDDFGRSPALACPADPTRFRLTQSGIAIPN